MEDDLIRTRRVGFGDCDPALIACTGKIADFALESLDAVCEDVRDGKGWYRMNVDKGYGMPFVRIEYDFRSPIRPGPTMFCRVRPTAVGTTSVSMHVEGEQDSRSCFTARCVSVFTRRADHSKMEIPAYIRGALNRRRPELAA